MQSSFNIPGRTIYIYYKSTGDERQAAYYDGKHIGYVWKRHNGWRSTLRNDAVTAVCQKTKRAAAEALWCQLFGHERFTKNT